ncbi:cell wall protein DAN4 isoform X2 [Sebastes umbrosus]|uniref:cell wall protein DAN4 isoform X2 n=1 Tax=Sebastes umbrosus TaxID=72105 RepID=UPI00189F4A3F|nr:cell wall protein DAN4 isoform X2 [Sebastes umbrosus]
MDNRLVLTVLFVMLSWISVGTYAQNATAAPNVTTVAGNMTTAAGNMTTAAGNMTTAAGNMTTAAPTMTTAAPTMTTAAGNNMTTAAPTMTTAAGNMTTAAGNMTTAAPTMTTAAPNMTTAASNMTTAAPTMTTAASNMTTAAPNMTTAAPNMTTAAPNMTTATTVPTTTPATTAATTTPATTVATITTLAPPLIPNTTVDNLVEFITRAGCGNTKLCLDQPLGCTPGAAAGCSFCSLRQTSGQNFVVELSGESGYIALSVSFGATQGGNAQTYVCANGNGVVRFFSTFLNNGVLTETVLNVNSVRGRVNGRNIQCIFAVTLPDSSNRAASLSAAVVSGTFNSTTGALGRAVSQIQTGVIDLANPSSNFTNLVTPSHGITLQQSLTQALLIAVGVLSLTRL